MTIAQSTSEAYLSDDYVRFGVAPGYVEPWENGLRTSVTGEAANGGSNFEWWYISSQLQNGEGSLVAVFHTKPTRDADGPFAPYVSIAINRPNKEPIERRIRVGPADFYADPEDCQVIIGRNFLARHGHYSEANSGLYDLHIEDKDLVVNMRLGSNAPAWRPKTGRFVFGEHNFGWVVPVPLGYTSGVAEINGEPFRLDVDGYHDHNFGDQNPVRLMSKWQWCHGTVGMKEVRHTNIPPWSAPLMVSTIGARLTAKQTYGGNTIPVFMACDHFDIPIRDGGEQLDSYMETGSPIAHSLYFGYNDSRRRMNVHFDGDTEIARRRPNIVGGAAIRASDASPSYRRFAGTATIDYMLHDSVEGLYNNLLVAQGAGSCILEGMYFGET